jgi:hypothetical protein
MRTFDKVLWAMGLTGIGIGALAMILSPAAPPRPVAAALPHQVKTSTGAPTTTQECGVYDWQCQNAILEAKHLKSVAQDKAEAESQAELKAERNDPCWMFDDPMKHANCFTHTIPH